MKDEFSLSSRLRLCDNTVVAERRTLSAITIHPLDGYGSSARTSKTKRRGRATNSVKGGLRDETLVGIGPVEARLDIAYRPQAYCSDKDSVVRFEAKDWGNHRVDLTSRKISFIVVSVLDF